MTRLQFFTHVGAWVPVMVLVINYFGNDLTADPIQAAAQRTGRTALILLILSLSCTPVRNLTGYRGVIKVRRTLGLYAFMYAEIHMLIFLGWDYGFNIRLIYLENYNKLYIWLGVVSLMFLIALALTSFKWWMRKLGKGWKLLHKTVYFTAIVAVTHFILARKGNLFTLQGDIALPLGYGAIILVLLFLRLSSIKRWLVEGKNKLVITRQLPEILWEFLDTPVF